MCKTCDRIQSILDISRVMSDIRDGDVDDLALEALALTPQGRGIKTARTAVNLSKPVVRKVAKSKAARKAGKNLSRALKEVNKKARTKGGKLRKGWTQSKVMKSAHKLAKGMK